MEQLTILDVVRYNDVINRYHKSYPYILDGFIKLILRKTQNDNIKKLLIYFGEWIATSYEKTDKFDKDLIIIPFKIVEGSWNTDEIKWFSDLYLDNIVICKKTCCFIPYKSKTLKNSKEIFYIFTQILRQKFGYDANLICIIDEILKSFIFI